MKNIRNKCRELAKKEQKNRYDKVKKLSNMELLKHLQGDCKEKWQELIQKLLKTEKETIKEFNGTITFKLITQFESGKQI